MYKQIVFVLAASASTAAGAQQPQPGSGDPKAKVPAIEHRSAFENYRRYSEPAVSGWREMNEEVRRIGGHVGIVREQPPKPGAKPAPDPGHGGHK